MKQILQEQPIQRQRSAEYPQNIEYHTRPYVSRPSSSTSFSPSSPSTSTIRTSPSPLRTPTPSPSYHDFSIPMPHLGEQTDYTENM